MHTQKFTILYSNDMHIPLCGTLCGETFKNGCDIHYRSAGRVPAGVPESLQPR